MRTTYSFTLFVASLLSLSLAACGGGGESGGVPVTMTLIATAAGPSEINLAWTAQPDPVLGYDIYRDGVPANSIHVSGTSFVDSSVNPGTRHCYEVYAVMPLVGAVGRSNTACATTQSVDTSNVVVISSANPGGAHSSLALDAANRVHISYFGMAGISYATNASGSWVISVLDPVGGSATSIAVDAVGAVHISYDDYDNSTGNHVLKYATNASGAWVISAIDSGTGGVNSIAVDPAGHVHIAYAVLLPNPHVNYATNATGSWVKEFVSGFGNNIRQVSIALDSVGTAHIGYAVGDGICAIRYANNSGGVWSDFVVNSSGANCGASLALDSSGRPYIGYMDAADLTYATNASGMWVSSVVDHLDWIGGNDVSMAVGPGNSLHISYQDSNADLKYVTTATGAWVTRYLDAVGSVGSGNSMKIDSSGTAHISYDDITNHVLKYTTTP